MNRSKPLTAATIRGAIVLETVETPAPSKIELALGLVVQHLISRIDSVFEARLERIARGEIISPYPQLDSKGRPVTTIAVGVDPLRQPLGRLVCNSQPFELHNLTEVLFGEPSTTAKREVLGMIRAALQRTLDNGRAGFVVLALATGRYPDQQAKTVVVTLHDPCFARELSEIVATLPRSPHLRLRPERTVIHNPYLRTTSEFPVPNWLEPEAG